MVIRAYLTQEQVLLQDTVRKWARSRLTPLVDEADRTDSYSRQAFDEIADAGYLALAVPEDHGGLGASLTDQCLVLEEIGYAFPAAAIMLTANLVASAVMRGRGGAAPRYLDRLAEGKTLACIALTEPGSGSDAASISTRAERRDGGYLLNGRKIFVTNGGVADITCVFARTGTKEERARGITAFVVEADTPGMSVVRVEEKMGLRGSQTAELLFEDVWIPKEQRIGEEGEGFYYIMEGFDFSRPIVGVIAVGLAQAAFDIAVDYANQREQFGQPIIRFQAVQLMLADMALAVESARALIYWTANIVDRQDEPVPYYSCLAKCAGSDAAMQVTQDAIQVLGGYGYMRDYGVERMMRDAKIFQIFEGTNQIMRLVVAQALTEKP